METNNFSTLGLWTLASPNRLLSAACCPDKDLVVLISRLGGRDRLSLWKIQGSRTWEVDVGLDEAANTQISGIAWSPDGQSIAVAHDPPCITLHSIQDGHRELTLPIKLDGDLQHSTMRLTNLWWFRDERPLARSSIPDIFKRNDVITGSAHSILHVLPLLDGLQEESQTLTATDIFAFQGTQTQASAPKKELPESIKRWPTLTTNLGAASIAANQVPNQPQSAAEADHVNKNSILVAADSHGSLHLFLDGTFSLGTLLVAQGRPVVSLIKNPLNLQFYAHLGSLDTDEPVTYIQPTGIELPLLSQRHGRDFAFLSSSARELTWYIIRVIRDMHNAWFGSESVNGARDLGPKWIEALNKRQREHSGQPEPESILDLTCLLITGRASEGLADFLQSAEQMTERSIQKWETTMIDALVKLRDLSEKRVASACQRLLLILEELKGWSQLPQYSVFGLQLHELEACVEMAERAIIISSWLSAIVRQELFRFKEFISWLRFEIGRSNELANPPRYDILEVNNYFISGLTGSSIDKWFTGSLPTFSLQDLGIMAGDDPLSRVLQRARNAVKDPTQLEWQANIKQKDLNNLERNLDVLVQELAKCCSRIFDHAAGAASRSAIVSCPDSITSQVPVAKPGIPSDRLQIRERIIALDKEGLQYLAMWGRIEQHSFLCIVRIRSMYRESSGPPQLEVALLECTVGDVACELLEAEFFDDDSLVIVYRLPGQEIFIGTVGYSDLGYQELQADSYVKVSAREDLIQDAVKRWRQGQLVSARLPISRCRELDGCKDGSVHLAVNGRIGRRVACVLDSQGIAVEAYDLEGDEDDMEVEPGNLEKDADEDAT